MAQSPRAFPAHRLALIQPFQVMEVQTRAQQLELSGRSIIHMEIGQPDFGAPPQVLQAAIEAIRGRTLGYTSALGIMELREALSRFYQERFAVDVSSQRIVITAGASGALLLALGLLIDPGDEVLMPDPCYPCYRNFTRLFEGNPVAIPVGGEQDFQLTLTDVQAHWSPRTRGVLLASPSNPTGTVIPRSTLAAIVSWVHARGGFVLVDEIYQSLVYGTSPETVLSISRDAYVINSFSKYFGMTGWRLGWMVVPERLVRDIEKLSQNLFICPSAPAQYAALAAFSPEALETLEERRLELQRRRDYLLPALRALGFSIPATPPGAFYLYADCSRFGLEASALALRILEEARVAITPGLDFGIAGAERHVRFAYTRSMAELEAGVERLMKSPLLRSAHPATP